MKNPKGSVYIQDWMNFHPITKQSTCDSYYLGIAKEVFQLMQSDDYDGLLYGLDDDDLKGFACFLTCYFEDVVSKTGIWQAFTAAHFELYNKYLPFYKLDEYFEDEINPQDIHFLIWYYLSGKFLDEYLSPIENSLIKMGYEIYEIFDREYETAPENVKLKSFLSIDENETDFYEIRSKIDWLFISSYLFHFQEDEFEMQMDEILNSKDKEMIKNAEIYANDFRDLLAVSTTSNLLAYRGNEWMARILGKNHTLYNDLIKLEKRKTGYFLYKGENEQHVILQHIATEKIVNVTKKSMEVLSDFKVDESVLYISLLLWKDEWWFTGVYSLAQIDEKLINEEKKSIQSLSLFGESDSEIENRERLYQSFLKYNHNKPIAFFENGKQIRTFIDGYMQFHNLELSTNDEEKPEDLKPMEAFPEEHENLNGIVYFERKEGLYFVLGLTDIIPDESNKTYNPEASIDIMDFFFSENCRPDLIRYLIDNYPLLINNYEEKTGEHFIGENVDFLLRFWKHPSYHV